MGDVRNTSDENKRILHNIADNQSPTRRERPLIGGSSENEDIALAKILQEQERAFLELRGLSDSVMENVPPHIVGQTSGSGSLTRPPGDGSCPEDMTDEELAWKLMQEEENAFQQRMMAMAGLAPGSSHGPQADVWDHNELVNDEDAIDPDELTYEELTTLGEVAGTVATGLTAEQMEKMRRKLYRDIQPLEDPCVVCQINFEECDSTVELPCKHVYHAECIFIWLERKKTCPQCGQEVN